MSALDQLPKWARKNRKSFNTSLPCPECGIEFSSVLDKRNRDGSVMRRRMCQNGHRFKTSEVSEQKLAKLLNLLERVTAMQQVAKKLLAL